MIIVVYTPYIMATFQIDADYEKIPLALSVDLYDTSHHPKYLTVTGYSCGPTYTSCETPLTPITSLSLTTVPDVIGHNKVRPLKAYWVEGVVYELQETRIARPWPTPSMVHEILSTAPSLLQPVFTRIGSMAPVPWTGALVRGDAS